MHTSPYRISFCILTVFSAIVIAADASDSTIAEFVMSEKLLQQFSITGKKTEPFQHHGQTLHPNLDLNVGIKLKDSDNGIAAQFGVSMTGRTTTHSSKKVGPFKGHQVNVTVQNDLDAQYTQDLLLNQGGLNAGTPKGSPKITPHISTSNDFRLLNRKVNGVAYSTAQQMVSEIVPKDKAALNEQITSNLDNSVSSAKDMLKKAMNQASSLIDDPESLPYKSNFSSRSGDKGYMKVSLTETKHNSSRKPRPVLSNSDQEASHYMLHQDALSDLIGEEIAGKEMRLSDLKAHLCSAKTKKMMDFCSAELPMGAENISIIFEKEKPIEFHFQDGKIGMKLNASYRMAPEDKNKEEGKLLTDADKRDVTGRTVPYSVEFSYAVDGRKAKLASFKVIDRYTESLPKRSFLGGLFGGSHADSEAKKIEPPKADPSAIFLTGAIKQEIYNAYKGALKEEFDWPVVSIPSKVEVDMNAKEATTKVSDTASLLPLSTKVENGWIAFSSYYCSEKTPSFGVSYRNSTNGSGIRVSAVFAGSPADFLGLQIGDTISSISESHDGGAEQIEASEETFPGFIKKLASNPETDKRKMLVNGTDKNGKAFTKEVVLCPSNYPHRENAEKLITAAKRLSNP